MTKDKLFETNILIDHPIDLVWNTFSDINLLCHWHPLMSPVDVVSSDVGIFDQDLIEDGQLIRKRLNISIIDRVEKQKLVLSVRPHDWEEDTLHNIAEFTFKTIDAFHSIDSRTEVRFCRYGVGLSQDKIDQIVLFAEEISNSIQSLKLAESGLHLTRD
jgi:uncharacterized protein YndB with AHSA1/START domain